MRGRHVSTLWTISRSFATIQSPPQNRQRRFPTLAQFLLRSRVIALYRSIVRAINQIPSTSPTRAEMQAFAREEFERNRAVKDETKIRFLLSAGKVEFEKMERYVMEQARK